MFAVLVALLILAAGVAAIYLLLKNMSEDGVDIAAPGSCQGGRCGPSCSSSVEEAEEALLQVADVGEQGKASS
ncbi:hypothetical protein LZ012_13185 [Dechloromonas sp. XY25]|uniref:(Na+)-NQR maturation NqrM n=1 Tax=Dechloromonas hankyongensis TaxID=2908002 RepID=A0ABS9K4F8_9RHOO|nr:hypothetical protein [Dechloromonas hankyongensis]MCG2577944.1 hypothetical protein [Dechloromonas hankyongensis]